ncbi:ISKra4 family transposase [Pseudanabaena sp. PCC 6802]|uniref:ISKra4 family transposase n=1 Tax=Pseudanabaena sp. PCC 6802 TaxID=118173 RepID=UPI0039A12BBC
MTPEQEKEMQAHVQAIAAILYQNTPSEQLTSLEGIEIAVRQQILEHVSPEIGSFFIRTVTGTEAGRRRRVQSSIGQLHLTQKQAQKLKVAPYSQVSPYVERCSLILSANVSYEQAAKDLAMLMGVQISRSTQQRLVHRHEFSPLEVEESVEELSVDGGRIRLRTPLGQPSEWKDYKAVNLHGQAIFATFQDNIALTDWVNRQPLADMVTCIGDGHDGIWNIIAQISIPDSRYEILDWFHLVENLHKIEATAQLLTGVEAFLWRGNVTAAIAELNHLASPQSINFIAYLHKHRHRIPDYWYFQTEQICSIGSGAVESAVKQIARRIKISGAQWNRDNVPQVLKHRSAYLNGSLNLALQN